MLTLPELEPVEIVSHSLPRDWVVRLGFFEMDAKHAKHLDATEAVEALWSEQEIANVFPQTESSECLEPDEVHQIANALPQIESSEFLEPDEVHPIANALPQMESSEFLEPVPFRMESPRTKGPTAKHLHGLLTAAVEFHRTKAGAEQLNHKWTSSSPCDGETCMGGNGTCCGMITDVSCSVEIHGVSGS